jgi:hypothetical protein
MHELLATIDDTTYQRIIEDARNKGIEPRDWIRHAINEFLSMRPSAVKEITPRTNETCSPGTIRVHAEIYSPHPGGDSHEIIEQLQRQVRELETERDNLHVLLDQYKGSANSVSGHEAEILTLSCEIEKNVYELDGMETTLEKLRLERDKLLKDPKATDRLSHIEREIERQQFEVENFSNEIEKLIESRDSLKRELVKEKNV